MWPRVPSPRMGRPARLVRPDALPRLPAVSRRRARQAGRKALAAGGLVRSAGLAERRPATGFRCLPRLVRHPGNAAALARRVCRRARRPTASAAGDVRAWFEAQFQPWALVNPDGGREGLVTGYYEPVLKGSRTRKPPYLSPVVRAARGHGGGRPRRGLSRAEEPAPARPSRGPQAGALLHARRMGEAGAQARRGDAAVDRRSARPVLHADPGLGAGGARRRLRACASAMPTRTAIRIVRSASG